MVLIHFPASTLWEYLLLHILTNSWYYLPFYRVEYLVTCYLPSDRWRWVEVWKIWAGDPVLSLARFLFGSLKNCLCLSFFIIKMVVKPNHRGVIYETLFRTVNGHTYISYYCFWILQHFLFLSWIVPALRTVSDMLIINVCWLNECTTHLSIFLALLLWVMQTVFLHFPSRTISFYH